MRALAVLGIALAACNAGHGNPDLSPSLTPISLAPVNKADVLFMIDNDGTAPIRTELEARLPELLKILDDFGKSNPVDYHFGVVTSDLGAGQFVLGGGQCHPDGDGGKLQALGSASDPSCVAPTGGMRFVDYDQVAVTSNLPPNQDLATTLDCMLSVGDRGCAFQHQLEAVYRALHDPPPENAGFLRSEALLVVLYLTDEDDCSADPMTDLFDPMATQYGALLSYRCTNYSIYTDGNASTAAGLMPYDSSHGPLMNPRDAPANLNKLFTVDRYINLFTQPTAMGGVKDDPSRIVVASIHAPPTGVESLLVNPNPQPPGPYTSCAGPPDGKTCEVLLQHSCIAAQNTQFFGDPAVRIEQVVDAVPSHQVTSMCDTSYQAALQGLGQLIVERVATPGCLPRAPQTPPNCRVTNGAASLPMCGAPPCWQLAKTDRCASGFKLVVNGASAPVASCELTQ